MDKLEFVASLVRSLAWPLAVIVIVLFLRAPLVAVLSGPVRRWKAGPAGIEVEFWERRIETVRTQLGHSPEVKTDLAPLPGLDDELARLVEVSPQAAVIEAFARVEAGLKRLFDDDDATKRLLGTRLAQAAWEHGRINEQTLNAIEGLAVLRDLAAHASADQTNAPRAMEFVTLANAVLFTLRGTHPPGSVSVAE